MYKVSQTLIYEPVRFGKITGFNIIKPKYKKIDDGTLAYSGSTIIKSLECKGSITLKSDNFKAAASGSDLHEKAERSIITAIHNEDFNDIQFEEEENNLDVYLNYLLGCIKKSTFFGVETFLNIKYKSINLRGSLDFWFYNEDQKFLEIVDLKTGAFLVAAKDNNQLLFYAFLLKNTILRKKDINCLKLSIFQSQDEHFDVYTYSTETLKFKLKELEDKLAILNNNEGFKFTTGSACKDCFKFSNCSAYLPFFLNLFKNYLRADVMYIKNPTNENYTEVYRAACELKPHINKIKKTIEFNFDNGKLKPFMDKVAGKPSYKWGSPKQVIKYPELTREVMKTPKQCAIFLNKAQRQSLINTIAQYTYKAIDKVEEDFYE